MCRCFSLCSRKRFGGSFVLSTGWIRRYCSLPMKKPPLILISPSVEKAGVEFSDQSISLSENYPRAVADSGGIPLTLPVGKSRELVAECVRRADGILLT